MVQGLTLTAYGGGSSSGTLSAPRILVRCAEKSRAASSREMRSHSMAKREQISGPIDPDLQAFAEQAAAREDRPVALWIRHLVARGGRPSSRSYRMRKLSSPATLRSIAETSAGARRRQRGSRLCRRHSSISAIHGNGADALLLPALRRRSPSPRHVLCDRGLSDIDAELEQLAVYPRWAPAKGRA
jgi:hypothetical protein